MRHYGVEYRLSRLSIISDCFVLGQLSTGVGIFVRTVWNVDCGAQLSISVTVGVEYKHLYA